MTELTRIPKCHQGLFARSADRKTSTTALDNVSIKLDEDEPTIMTVAGESGSGKTTLAMLLLGFITPTSGQILYQGQGYQQAARR